MVGSTFEQVLDRAAGSTRRPHARCGCLGRMRFPIQCGLMSLFGAIEMDAFLGSFDASRVIVIVATMAAFAGAWAVARHVRAGGPVQPQAGTSDAPIVGVDLIDPSNPRLPEPKIVRIFEAVLLVVLLAYAFLDRGFAWFHIPGTPLFVGELVLVLGAVAMLSHPTRILSRAAAKPALEATWCLHGVGTGAPRVPRNRLRNRRNPRLRDLVLRRRCDPRALPCAVRSGTSADGGSRCSPGLFHGSSVGYSLPPSSMRSSAVGRRMRRTVKCRSSRIRPATPL